MDVCTVVFPGYTDHTFNRQTVTEKTKRQMYNTCILKNLIHVFYIVQRFEENLKKVIKRLEMSCKIF